MGGMQLCFMQSLKYLVVENTRIFEVNSQHACKKTANSITAQESTTDLQN